MLRRGVMFKTKANSFFPAWVRQRELRPRLPLGHSDVFYKSLYSSISPCHSWGGGETSESEHGGFFSLEFSPDGTLLVAGCDKNCFLLFDPLSRRLISTVQKAHDGCVAHVKFLDSRIFATGGVDGTVSLWDSRNLKSQFRTLLGHAYVIGNIEFSRKQNLLLTTALDGTICMWDMKDWNPREEVYKRTFWSPILLRLRLNHDETKMVISTGSGFFFIVHELDLNTFAQDLDEFELEMNRSAIWNQPTSTSCQIWSGSVSYNRRRNRVELVSDFPNAGRSNVISALEIHPQGWSAFSRSVDEKNKQEWTCVHDIQERESSKGRTASREGSVDEYPPALLVADAGRAKQPCLEGINELCLGARGDGNDPDILGRASEGVLSSKDFGSQLPDGAFSLERRSRERRSVSSADTARAMCPSPAPSSLPSDLHEFADIVIYPDSFRVQEPSLSRHNLGVAHFNQSAYECLPRMTHYVEEPYSSDWYIESLGISADGRLVCSPFQCGIRCFAFSPECSDQSVSLCGEQPRRLHELSTHISHKKSVLRTTFSPRHCFLVSGCLDGKLAWYQPIV